MRTSANYLACLSASIFAAVLLVLFTPLRAISAPRVQSKVSVWTVVQQNPWAKLTVHANANAIRIDGSTGGSIIAKAPTWEVVVFHTRDHRARTMTIAQWAKGNIRACDVERIGGKPVALSLHGGVPALKYSWKESGMGSTSANADMLFRGQSHEKPKDRSFVTISVGNRGLSPEVVEVWRLLLEIPLARVVPLESGTIFLGGDVSYTTRFLSEKKEILPISTFDYPKNFNSSNDSVFTVFFGKQAEDMAEIFWGN